MEQWLGTGKTAAASSSPPPPPQQKQKQQHFFSPMPTRHGSSQQEQSSLPKRFLYVGASEMQLQEIDYSISIETNVTYFILPEEDFGAFVRRTTVTNINIATTLILSILDGLAQMEPAGDGGEMDDILKYMGRTLQGWMGVYSPYNDTLECPFIDCRHNRVASVMVQMAGHWCISVLEIDNDDNDSNAGIHNLPIVYDMSKIFGQEMTLLTPVELYDKTIHDIIRGPQYALAFAAMDQVELKAGQSLTVTFLSLIQADGYNPLSVGAIVFVIRDFEACKKITTRAVGEAAGHRAQREAHFVRVNYSSL